MRKFFLLLILYVALPSFIVAQNLVKNPSFECGTNDCDCTLVPDWLPNLTCYWSCPNNATSDIFSTTIANKACFSSMPYAGIERSETMPHIGSIMPRTGSRFAGIFTYGGKSREYREYLQAELTSPLVPGKYYCFEMYVALTSQPRYASNNLGVSFYDEFIRVRPYYGVLALQPQVIEKKVIMSSDWTRIAGVFRATSAANYLSIGNFFGDAQTTVVDKGGTYQNLDSYWTAYYFVDDVSVQLLPEKKFTYSGQYVVCKGDYTTVSAAGGLENVSWSLDTDTTNIVSNTNVLHVKPDATTRYRVTGWNCGLFVKDTLTVHVNKRPEPTLGDDKVACEDDVVKLDAGSGYTSYSWTTSAESQTIEVRKPGAYRVYVFSKEGCAGTDEITVDFELKPRIDLGKDVLLCSGSLLLSGGSGDFSYEWSTSSNDSTIVADRSGLYWVVKTNNCGVARDSINVMHVDDTFMQNVITINDDRKNDKLIIGFADGEQIHLLEPRPHIRICDRWGKIIFENKEYDNTWPGSSEIPDGTLYYSIQIPGCGERKSWLQVVK